MKLNTDTTPVLMTYEQAQEYKRKRRKYKLKLISKLEKVNKEIHDKNLFPKDYLLDAIKHIAGFDKIADDINN